MSLRLKGDQHGRDVVSGTAVQGEVDKMLHPGLGIGISSGAIAKVVVANEVGQAVAGEQESVAGLRGEGKNFGALHHIGAAEEFV